MRFILRIFKAWLPLAAAITLLSGLIYLTVQQDIRLGANDPQIQMAEDTARALADGQPADKLVSSEKVDIAASLAPYLIIFDPSGNAIASNAVLHNTTPKLPPGVLEFTRQHEQDRITWQPEQGVRSAVVIVSAAGGKSGYVLAGRSLREVEQRVDLLTTQVGLGLSGTLLVTLILVILFQVIPFRQVQG